MSLTERLLLQGCGAKSLQDRRTGGVQRRVPGPRHTTVGRGSVASSAMSAFTSAHPKRAARPWLAALLSLLRPGLGHVYVGRIGLGVAIWLGLLILGIAVLWIATRRPGRFTIFLLVTLAVCAPIAVATHAWHAARQPPRGPPRQPLGVAGAVVGAFVLSALIAVPVKSWVRRSVAEAKRLADYSMGQTLAAGDWVFVVPQGDRPLERGQLAAFRHEGETRLKRIVALPGDTIGMRDGVLIRNGQPQDEPYAIATGAPYDDSASFAWQSLNLANPRARDRYRPTADSWGPLVVPPRFTFMLGDDRHESLDSRYFGWVSHDSIVGRPAVVYFSRSPDSSRVRWDRVGRVISR